jgi:hypothetical protein
MTKIKISNRSQSVLIAASDNEVILFRESVNAKLEKIK